MVLVVVLGRRVLLVPLVVVEIASEDDAHVAVSCAWTARTRRTALPASTSAGEDEDALAWLVMLMLLMADITSCHADAD